MRPLAILTCVLIAAGCGGAAASGTTEQLVAIGAGLRGPDGLHASVYAQGLAHASAFAVDSGNRLWVTTAAYTDDGHDGIWLVPASGAAPVEIVAGLHTPMGMVWYHDELYVASKERVDAYSALAGTRFTKHRTVVTLPVGVGESNNLALAPDGRMLLGISAPCDHCTPSSQYSAAVLSFELDGTDVRVFASGIRAPIGLAFAPGTSDLFVTMNQRDDLGDQTPGDWLSLVTAGSDWGFPDCYGQGGSECDGVPTPTAELDKHAAVSGVVIVTDQLGARAGDAALAAEWSTGKVVSVALDTHRVSTFLTGVKNPVALLLTPNGSLFVGDWTTGSVYEVVR